MWGNAVRQRPAALLVVAVAFGCNAISGIDDFSASDPPDSNASGGVSASGGAAAIGGAGGSGGSAAAAGTEGSSGAAGAAGVTGAAGDAGADVVPVEQCGGGTDDDADGKIDCFDSDCRDDPACAGFCSDGETLPCNIVRRSQASSGAGSTARIGPPLYGCAGARDEPGPEFAYRVTVPEAQRVFVELFGLDGDMSAYAVDVPSSAQCDARSGCVTAGASGSGTLAESLTFSSAAGRDYYLIVDGPAAGMYSISVQCSGFDGCIPARAIEAGQTVTGSLVMGSAPNITQKLTTYSCGGGGSRGAPEAAFMFTPTADGNYRIDLTELMSNADLFVLAAPNCNAVCLNPNSKSNSPTGNESLVLAATGGTTYYIVIDGFATTGFTLGVTRL